MAKNTGESYRQGHVKNRSQVYNPKTDSWVKKDTETGKFIEQKTSDNKSFMGARKEE